MEDNRVFRMDCEILERMLKEWEDIKEMGLDSYKIKDCFIKIWVRRIIHLPPDIWDRVRKVTEGLDGSYMNMSVGNFLAIVNNNTEEDARKKIELCNKNNSYYEVREKVINKDNFDSIPVPIVNNVIKEYGIDGAVVRLNEDADVSYGEILSVVDEAIEQIGIVEDALKKFDNVKKRSLNEDK